MNRTNRKYRVAIVPKRSLAMSIREWHATLRELVQLSVFLLLSGISLGVVLVGAFRLRMWLG